MQSEGSSLLLPSSLDQLYYVMPTGGLCGTIEKLMRLSARWSCLVYDCQTKDDLLKLLRALGCQSSTRS